MKRWIAVVTVMVGLAGTSQAFAQESPAGPGTVNVTVIPGGAAFFVEGKDTNGPSFANYGLGAGVDVNFNRYVGVEAEVTGALGVTQDLQFTTGTLNLKTPNLVSYSGNLVVSAANKSAVVPYVTGGVGGLTLLDQSALAISQNKTFLTGNVGAGLKWFNRTGRWGLRGDYRFLAVRSDDEAPSFFGRETRYGHRIYGGVLINAVR
jgi:outer membrane protein with beta-barrel domain